MRPGHDLLERPGLGPQVAGDGVAQHVPDLAGGAGQMELHAVPRQVGGQAGQGLRGDDVERGQGRRVDDEGVHRVGAGQVPQRVADGVGVGEREGAGGAAVVVGLGAAFAQLLPAAADLTANSQITARTAPSLLDLLAAVATGLAGAVGLARRDVADVMPGVAIAISLVPSLAVVGVTLGSGQGSLALGALVLFLSNVLALVLAGTLVFTAYGYAAEAYGERGLRRRRAYGAIAATLVLVLVPLGANTFAQVHQTVWTAALREQVDAWLNEHDSTATVQRVSIQGTQAVVEISTDRDLPGTDALLDSLVGHVPDGTEVVIQAEYGVRVEVGTVGT